MKKTDPRLILNINIKDEELEKKIELAVDDYIDKNAEAIIDKKIEQYITKRVEDYFDSDLERETHWRYRNFSQRANRIVDGIIDRVVTEKIADKITNKLSVLLGKDIEDKIDE